jgi:hypothetical protein
LCSPLLRLSLHQLCQRLGTDGISGHVLASCWTTLTVCHVIGRIRTRWPFFRVREPANRVWFTNNQTWSSHSPSTCVPTPKAKVHHSDPSATRPYSQKLGIAYPPLDTEIRAYIDSAGSDVQECKARFLHLLAHLFRTVSDELSSIYQKKQPTYAALAMAWCKHMDEGHNRARIYKKAVNQCQNSDLVRPLFTVSYSSLIVLARPNCKRITRFQKEMMILPQCTLRQN